MDGFYLAGGFVGITAGAICIATTHSAVAFFFGGLAILFLLAGVAEAAKK